MKKDTYYFSHDSNAKDDPKCMSLIDDLGMEGYGIFWVLIEMLRNQPDYKCPLSIIKSIARQYNTTPPKVEVVIKNYGLFTIEDDLFFFSESLLRRMEVADNKRKKLSEAGKVGNEKRWSKSISSPPDSQVIATQSLLKEIKVNKIKIKEINIEEIIEYFTSNGYTSESAKKFFNYYSVAEWKDGNGKPVKNWKQKAQAVWFKDENKMKPKTFTKELL